MLPPEKPCKIHYLLGAAVATSVISKLQDVYLNKRNVQLGQKLIDKTKGYGRRQVTQGNTC